MSRRSIRTALRRLEEAVTPRHDLHEAISLKSMEFVEGEEPEYPDGFETTMFVELQVSGSDLAQMLGTTTRNLGKVAEKMTSDQLVDALTHHKIQTALKPQIIDSVESRCLFEFGIKPDRVDFRIMQRDDYHTRRKADFYQPHAKYDKKTKSVYVSLLIKVWT